MREAAIQSLPRSFDKRLAKVEFLRVLMSAVDDLDFNVRIMAIRTLDRFYGQNPAALRPLFHRVLLQEIAQLESDKPMYKSLGAILVAHGLQGNACWVCRFEYTLQILASVIHTAPDVVDHHSQNILNILLGVLEASSGEKSVRALEVIGELALSGNSVLAENNHRVLPFLIRALQDKGNVRRRGTAIRVLGQVVRYIRFTVDPETEYSTLYGVLVKTFNAEQVDDLRIEFLRLLGNLGSVDPTRYVVRGGPLPISTTHLLTVWLG